MQNLRKAFALFPAFDYTRKVKIALYRNIYVALRAVFLRNINVAVHSCPKN